MLQDERALAPGRLAARPGRAEEAGPKGLRALRREGYRVEYSEFEGGHTVPHEVARGALAWFLEGREGRSPHATSGTAR